MKIQLPEKVNRIITTLQKHGFEAYAVGGSSGILFSDVCRVTGISQHRQRRKRRSHYLPELLTPESSMERLRCF